MSQNFQAPGKKLVVACPYATVDAGEGVKVGSIFGVACDDALTTEDVVIDTEGVHEIQKVGSQAWTVGQLIYWDDSSEYCTTSGAAGMFIGVATEAVASGAGDVLGKVKLAGPSPMLEGAQAAEAALSGTLTGTANGSMVDIAATAAATVGGATPTAAQVDTGIALAVSTIVSGTNEQLKELQTKLNAVMAKLVLAGILLP